jgi:hypothetical protein
LEACALFFGLALRASPKKKAQASNSLCREVLCTNQLNENLTRTKAIEKTMKKQRKKRNPYQNNWNNYEKTMKLTKPTRKQTKTHTLAYSKYLSVGFRI